MEERELVLIVVLVLMFVIWPLYSMYLGKVRREAMMKVASELRFSFQETGSADEKFAMFKIFSLGRDPDASNEMFGNNGTDEIWTFDYKYKTGSGKSTTVHTQTLCIIRSKALSLPHFFLRRESRIWDFFGKLFGGQDINIDDDQPFSSAFVLQGENESDVRSFFGAGVRRVFMDFQDTDFQIEGRKDAILVNPCVQIEPDKIKAFMSRAIALKKSIEVTSLPRTTT